MADFPDQFERMDVRVTSMEARLTELEKLGAVEDVHYGNLERRLTNIEDTLKWLVRLIIGAIALAAVSFAISGGFMV